MVVTVYHTPLFLLLQKNNNSCDISCPIHFEGILMFTNLQIQILLSDLL